MLDTVFLTIVDMTMVASLVIAAVLLTRLLLRRAPKVYSYLLWSVVLFRLLCPVSIETPVSLIPQTEETVASYDQRQLNEPISPPAAIDIGPAAGSTPTGGIDIRHIETTDTDNSTARVISSDRRDILPIVGKYVWVTGIAVLLLYSAISYGKLRRKLRTSVYYRDNIYRADHIASPFVMGVIRPKIYLPSSLTEKECEIILPHEEHHIRRGDHIVKLLSFAALCLHWFNPLVWVAFILSGRDMEMSCDEAVLRRLGNNIRIEYSTLLIRLSTGHKLIAGPLAFGEGNTEGRLRNIARWKKPAVWVSITAVICCTILAVCFITNPIHRDTQLYGAEYWIDEILYRTDNGDNLYGNDLPGFCITADYCLWQRGWDDSQNEYENWSFIGKLEPYTLSEKELSGYTAQSDSWRRRYKTGEITDSYILRTENDGSHYFYLAFRTKKGDTLLGYGMEDISERGQGSSDDTALFWLIRLESTLTNIGNAGMFLDRSLAMTVGGDVDTFSTWTNDAKPGYVIVGFLADKGEFTEGFEAPSSEKPDMGFAVFYHNKDESGYRLLQCRVYEGAADKNNGIFFCPDPATLDLSGEMKSEATYDVVLLNNPEIKQSKRVWEYADGTTKTESNPFVNIRCMELYSWKNDKAGCKVWQYFYDADGEVIKSYPVEVETDVTAKAMAWAHEQAMAEADAMEQAYNREKENADVLTREYERAMETATDLEASYKSAKAYADTLAKAYEEAKADAEQLSGANGITTADVYAAAWESAKEMADALEQQLASERKKIDALERQLTDKRAEVDAMEQALTDKQAEVDALMGAMQPTEANVTGVFDTYLYVPLNGANYRYEVADIDPVSVTKGDLLYTFTEEGNPSNIDWRIYAIEEYPSYSLLLAEAGKDDYIQYLRTYRYSPSKGVVSTLLETLKEAGIITIEDGYATCGEEQWRAFYEKTAAGESASVSLAHYYTLENSNVSDTYYEVYKEDYPALFILDLTYDGDSYTLTWEEYGTFSARTFRYLMQYEGVPPAPLSSNPSQKLVRYVLTNDDTVTWDDIVWSHASSLLRYAIEHYTVYVELE